MYYYYYIIITIIIIIIVIIIIIAVVVVVLSLILLLLTIVIIIRRHTETPTEENVEKFLAYYISLATSQVGRKQTMQIKEVAGKFQHAQT